MRDAPDAFGSVLDDALRLDDETWRARLQNIDPARDLPLAAWQQERIVGMTWVSIAALPADGADLYQMFTLAELRGQGRLLLQAALVWAKDQGVKRMVLSVTEGNAAAESLYLAAGFEFFGDPEPLREGSVKQVRHMQCWL